MEPDQKIVLSVKFIVNYIVLQIVYISFFSHTVFSLCIFAFWNLINAKVRSLHATFIRYSCHV